ncbi:MAG: hypothetical protein MUO24_03235 [Desulfobacterales bacterium]|nr:hypothetical protein [Desulfobacterales bacterium]
MLFTPDEKQIKRVPHASDLKAAIRLLGAGRTKGVRRTLNRLIDEMPPAKEIGARTFSSSRVASQLEPWPYPLAGLYDIALEIEGKDATGRQVHDRAFLIFGLFVWECIMARKERWVLYDHKAGSSGPHQEIMGTIYQELGLD